MGKTSNKNVGMDRGFKQRTKVANFRKDSAYTQD